MNLKEYDENRFQKEQDNLDKYLLRIIQRYFDIEQNHTQESIEAIIVESLTRLKRELLDNSGFIFSLNKETGHIILTIKDFGGEYEFDKNIAFNKDFGTDTDTICEGNDPRLSDNRDPNEHVHVIADIRGLQEALNEIGVVNRLHIHTNQKILDILKYTGSKTEIDLIMLEYLKVGIEQYCNNIRFRDNEVYSCNIKYIETLNDIEADLLQYFENIKVFVQTAVDWIDKAYRYTDAQTEDFKNLIYKKLADYATKENIKMLMEFFKRTYTMIADGEIPIPDGEFILNPVEEDVVIEASSEDGDSLKDIYDQGLRVGVDDWAWDGSSFVFQSNQEYAMFISMNKFNVYTHRVTLNSTHIDDGTISVVLAYDEETKRNLTLHCSVGGMQTSAFSSATLMTGLNENMGEKLVTPIDIGIAYVASSLTEDGTRKGWKALSTGITILIKRDNNHFKIWVNFDTTNTWIPTKNNVGINDINDPSIAPTLEFDLTDYDELACFVGKASNYGYGCCSQTYSRYLDVFFMSPRPVYEEPYGHTDICEQKEIEYTVPASIMSKTKQGNIKTYFRYNKNGHDIDTPLPFTFLTDDSKLITIQSSYDKDGRIYIETNLFNTFKSYLTQNNFYKSDVIIAACSVDQRTYIDTEKYLEEQGCSLCLIDSKEKSDFVNNLLYKREYFIQGHSDFESTDTTIKDNNGNPITYTNWDTDQPKYSDDANVLFINKNKKWAIAEDWWYNKKGYILECKIQRLSNYFTNPRVYYQVFGTKEGL